MGNKQSLEDLSEQDPCHCNVLCGTCHLNECTFLTKKRKYTCFGAGVYREVNDSQERDFCSIVGCGKNERMCFGPFAVNRETGDFCLFPLTVGCQRNVIVLVFCFRCVDNDCFPSGFFPFGCNINDICFTPLGCCNEEWELFPWCCYYSEYQEQLIQVTESELPHYAPHNYYMNPDRRYTEMPQLSPNRDWHQDNGDLYRQQRYDVSYWCCIKRARKKDFRLVTKLTDEELRNFVETERRQIVEQALLDSSNDTRLSNQILDFLPRHQVMQ